MMPEKLKPGDIVAVVGGTIEKEGEFEKTAEIATVVEPGLHEVFVEIKQSYSTYVIKVPKKACQKIDVSKKRLAGPDLESEPEVGDLVLSYKNSSTFSRESPDKISGVLYKVTYKFGKKDTCIIMSGTDFHEVKFSSLIVLQKEAS